MRLKQSITLFACIIISLNSIAQKDKEEAVDYKLMREDMEQKLFNTPDPLFANNKPSDQYKNESAVILAERRSQEITSKKKYNFFVPKSARTTFTFLNIYHAKIYLNDKSALDEYSELTFNQLEKKTKTILGKYKDYSFINIRLIKPNGSIQKVNIAENSTTVDDKKDTKKNKIAIPDLAIGDVVEYYVVKWYDVNAYGLSAADLTYVLTEDYPIEKFQLHLSFDKNFAVYYQTINGAPDFKLTPLANEEGTDMDLSAINLPKTKNTLWYSVARQLPIIRVKYSPNDIKKKDLFEIKKGEVIKTRDFTNVVEKAFSDAISEIFESQTMATYITYSNGFSKARHSAEDAFKEHTKLYPDAKKNVDSIIPFVYNYYQWHDFYYDFNLKTDFASGYNNRGLYEQILAAIKYAYTLDKEFGIQTDLLLTGSRDDVSRMDVFDITDLNILVRATGANNKYYYFSFGDNLYHIGQLPASIEGEKAKLVPFDFNHRSIDFKGGQVVTLPSSTATDNNETENIVAQIAQGNMQLLTIDRKQTSMGYQRRGAQSSFATFEDMALQASTIVYDNRTLVEQYNDKGKKFKKDEAELTFLLQKSKEGLKEKIEKEIEGTYDSKPEKLESYKINKLGASTTSSTFEFEETFTMNGWIKKAGNNYIIDAGKLLGSQLEIKPEQRNRAFDVYMPYPRSFNYHIEFIIPEGYAAEGVDKFNKKKENGLGGFVSIAKIENGKIIIDTKKYYNTVYSPVADWEKITAFVDEAFAITKEKILLRKK